MANPGSQYVTPLYFQIKQTIQEKISSGELKPGDMLPSETQLMGQYNVSRITVRRAIKELTQQGVVFSRQGKGSIVAEAQIREMSGFRSFSEDILSRGMKPSSKIIECSLVEEPDENILNQLHLESGEQVYRLRRVRLADDEPVAYEDVHTPERLFPNLDKFDFNHQSLFSVFRDHYRMFPVWADAEIEARAATPDFAEYLDINVGDPILVSMRWSYLDSFVVVEYTQSVYSGRRFTFYSGRQYIG